MDGPTYCTCDDCERRWRPKLADDHQEKAAFAEDRLTALEAEHAKAAKRAELAHDAITAMGTALEAAYKRIERLERVATDLASYIHVTGSPSIKEDRLRQRLHAVRQDLAEIDRRRGGE